MPIYEYLCDQDGAVIELVRPVDRADDPVPDPEGKGRVFRRRLSTFASRTSGSTASGQSGGLPMGGCCPCGKSAGSCASRN